MTVVNCAVLRYHGDVTAKLTSTPVSKRCPKCDVTKPASEFFAKKNSFALQAWCKNCLNVSVVQWRGNNPEKAEAAKRLWVKNNPDRVRRYKRDEKIKLKLQVISAYGGVCICCGEDRIFFLSIDHVKGDGASDREEINKPGSGFYYHLKKLGYPDRDRYQILCYNCNLAKKTNAYCPCSDPGNWYHSEIPGQLALFSDEDLQGRKPRKQKYRR